MKMSSNSSSMRHNIRFEFVLELAERTGYCILSLSLLVSESMIGPILSLFGDYLSVMCCRLIRRSPLF